MVTHKLIRFCHTLLSARENPSSFLASIEKVLLHRSKWVFVLVYQTLPAIQRCIRFQPYTSWTPSASEVLLYNSHTSYCTCYQDLNVYRPTNFLYIMMNALTKQIKPKKSSHNYIIMISHTCKLVARFLCKSLKIKQKRLQRQFDFRKYKGTRNVTGL